MINDQIFIGIGLGIIIMSPFMIYIFLQHKHDVGKFLSKIEKFPNDFSKETIISEMKRQRNVFNILLLIPVVLLIVSTIYLLIAYLV